MAKSKLSQWSKTAADNTDLNDIPIVGSVTKPGQVDDLFREEMAQIATWFSKGANMASAATLVLNNSTTSYVNVTGTTAVTAITLDEGQTRMVRAVGALPLTASANLIVNGSTSISYTCSADEVLFIEGYAAGVVRVWVFGFARTTLALTNGLSLAGGNVTVQRTAADTLTISGNSPASTVLNLPGGKIAFPAAPTLSSDPYILDRFGKGTWTPRFAPQTGAFGAVTYSEQTGTFTVIGNQSIENFILAAATVVAGTGGGQLRIEGRPYTGVGNQAGYIAVSVGFITNHPCSCSSVNGTTALLLYYRSTGNGRTFTLATSTEVPIGPGVAPWTATVWGGGAFVA